jgi:hypothetical protein
MKNAISRNTFVGRVLALGLREVGLLGPSERRPSNDAMIAKLVDGAAARDPRALACINLGLSAAARYDGLHGLAEELSKAATQHFDAWKRCRGTPWHRAARAVQ